MAHTGSCLCGAMSYRSDAEPFYFGNCYCACCRKESGTGHATNLALAEAEVGVTGRLTGYVHTADSGATIESFFCPRCGSTIYAKSASFPNVAPTHAGTIDDGAAVAPQMNLFVGHAPAWDPPSLALPGVQGMPLG